MLYKEIKIMRPVLSLRLGRVFPITDVLTAIKSTSLSFNYVCKRQFQEQGKMADGQRREIFLVVGLGNLDRMETRHSIGMRVLDKLADTLGLRFLKEKQCQSMIALTEVCGMKLILSKPRNPMNLNGRSVGKTVKQYSVSKENIILVHDELEKAAGKIAVKKDGGSAKGHNGVKSVAAVIPSGLTIPRVLVGIGRPVSHDREDVVEHVLSNFTREEQGPVDQAVEEAVRKITELICERTNIDILSGNEEGKDRNNNELT